MTDLDKLEELAKAATPGPWVQWDDGDVGTGYPVTRTRRRTGELVAVESDHVATTMHETGAFIAAANPAAVLDLIADHRAALARIAKVEAVHQRVGAPWPHIGGVYVCRADNSVWPCATVRALTEGENE